MTISEGGRVHFQPPDASVAPRYTGPRTFARLPHVELPRDDVDAAVIGVPFDTATSFRTGARFGPEAIRSASAMLRPYHPALEVDVFATLSVVDGGDLQITPGNAQRTADQIASGLEPLLRAGIVPVVLGGDHSIVLGELRAHAAVHGPVGLVLLDAHADTWDQYYGERYFHGTPFRRAVEEGLLDPSRSLLAGMRGSATGRCTCPSTSTCWTRPLRPEPGRPRWRASTPARHSGSCGPSPGSGSRALIW
jgi:agmatinase